MAAPGRKASLVACRLGLPATESTERYLDTAPYICICIQSRSGGERDSGFTEAAAFQPTSTLQVKGAVRTPVSLSSFPFLFLSDTADFLSLPAADGKFREVFFNSVAGEVGQIQPKHTHTPHRRAGVERAASQPISVLPERGNSISLTLIVPGEKE